MQEAWDQCGKVDGCGAVMKYDGDHYYLRRVSDPDADANDGEIYLYKCSEGTTTTTTPSPAPTPYPTATPGGCCDMERSDPFFSQCDYWGDPHWVTSFGQGKFDQMEWGPYRNAINDDGSFEAQNLQCRWGGKGKGWNVVTGMAMKLEGNLITFTNTSVYINGKMVTSDDDIKDVNIGGSLDKGVTVMSKDCCYRAQVKVVTKNAKGKRLWAQPHFYMDASLTIPAQDVAKRGVCGKGSSYNKQLGADSLLWDKDSFMKACQSCDPKPPQCEEGFHGGDQEVPINNTQKETAEQVCAAAANQDNCPADPLSRAQELCTQRDPEAKQFCMEDFCASGCDEVIAEMDNEVEKDNENNQKPPSVVSDLMHHLELLPSFEDERL
jgi:hypothetical protein